jgi:hypothetical protein
MVARPFWIIGHNTNTLELVRKAVDEGANALEIDVHDTADGRWVVSHDAPSSDAPELGEFLRPVSSMSQHSAVCLVTLDCKTYNPALTTRLFSLARDHWAERAGASARPYIVSVPHQDNLPFFEPVFGELRELEGLMIDEDDDPEAVAKALARARNPCFGDGITTFLPGPDVRPAMEHAAAIQARDGSIKFTYSWTFTQVTSLAEQLDLGVDGIITDNVPGLATLVRERPTTVRLATAADNPFANDLPGYALAVRTSADASSGGSLELTLHGDRGSAAKLVSASPSGRFEAGRTTFVTLRGEDVGEPRSISARAVGAPFALESVELLTPSRSSAPVARFETVVAPDATVERPIGRSP